MEQKRAHLEAPHCFTAAESNWAEPIFGPKREGDPRKLVVLTCGEPPCQGKNHNIAIASIVLVCTFLFDTA
jgi:hypothetical protein